MALRAGIAQPRTPARASTSKAARNVTGSPGDTPISAMRRICVTPNATGNPIAIPSTSGSIPCVNTQPENIALRAAQRQAYSNFLSTPAHRVRDHRVQSHRSEQQRDGSEDREHGSQKVHLKPALRQPVFERAHIVNRKVFIRCLNGAAERFGQHARGDPSPRHDEHSRGRFLAVWQVNQRILL